MRDIIVGFRQVIQDLLVPELKAIQVELRHYSEQFKEIGKRFKKVDERFERVKVGLSTRLVREKGAKYKTK